MKLKKLLKRSHKSIIDKWNSLKKPIKIFFSFITFLALIWPFWTWLYPTYKDFKNTDQQESMDGINLRIGASNLLNPNKKYVLFYSTLYDTAYYYTKIPITVFSTYDVPLDSIELGIQFPKEGKFELEGYNHGDSPDLVTRNFMYGSQNVEIKYTIRRLYKNYNYLLEEPTILPITKMCVNVKDSSSIKNLRMDFKGGQIHDLDELKIGNKEVYFSWDFLVYSSDPIKGVINYEMGICRYKVSNRNDLIARAAVYLSRLNKIEKDRTVALILFDENEKYETVLKKDSTISKLVRNKIDLSNISEIYIDDKGYFVEEVMQKGYRYLFHND